MNGKGTREGKKIKESDTEKGAAKTKQRKRRLAKGGRENSTNGTGRQKSAMKETKTNGNEFLGKQGGGERELKQGATVRQIGRVAGKLLVKSSERKIKKIEIYKHKTLSKG